MADILTIAAHRQAVENVCTHGGTTPEEWDRLVGRWEMFLHLGNDADARLANAVLGDSSEADVAGARAFALVALTAGHQGSATCTQSVATALQPALTRAYKPVAEQNYLAVAAKFDEAARALAEAIATVSPDIKTKDLVKRTKRDQEAWLAIEIHSNELNDTIPALLAAANLAGLAKSDRAPTIIALTVDTEGLHRRRVWEAWKDNKRHGGNWAALLGIGAKIRAHSFERVHDYREPKPMEHRPVRTELGVRMVEFDPEDPT